MSIIIIKKIIITMIDTFYLDNIFIVNTFYEILILVKMVFKKLSIVLKSINYHDYYSTKILNYSRI